MMMMMIRVKMAGCVRILQGEARQGVWRGELDRCVCVCRVLAGWQGAAGVWRAGRVLEGD